RGRGGPGNPGEPRPPAPRLSPLTQPWWGGGPRPPPLRRWRGWGGEAASGPRPSSPQRQLLPPPVEQLGDVELVCRRARDLVDPSELLRLFARFAQHAEHLAVERHLVDAAGKRVRGEHDLVRTRRDADRPRRAG